MYPPIGVVDSGVGGLTVLSRLVELLPRQPFLYVADRAWCPYGPRPRVALRGRLRGIVDYLLAEGCHMVVLACNTATAAAIETLRHDYSVPFVGMEPAVKPAALHSRTGHIGVLATQGTLAGALFQRTATHFGDRVAIHYAVGEGLVQMVEGGTYDGEAARDRLRRILRTLLEYEIDHLVLGCTHYPYLFSALRGVLPSGVTVVDPAPAVALQAARVAHAVAPVPAVREPLSRGDLRLVSTGFAADLPGHLAYLLGGSLAGLPLSVCSNVVL